jgi:hypothetical protein
VRVLLLGPQRRPTLGPVMASLDIDGPVATITAGWQDREDQDAELSDLLGAADVNLRLYGRWLEVQDGDQEFAHAQRGLQQLLDHAQQLYLVRLDHALGAVYAVQRAAGADRLSVDAITEAIAAVGELDAGHLRRVNNIRGEFYARWQPHERPLIARHRAEVAELLGRVAAVAIAGGHVGVLADLLHLFNVAPALASPVIAWSAGAMALTDQIVLFGERFPHGPGHAEVSGAGLSVVRGLVLLPHARARLVLDDAPRMAVFARRFAPARCVLLEAGTRLDASAVSAGAAPPASSTGLDHQTYATVLAPSGRVIAMDAA